MGFSLVYVNFSDSTAKKSYTSIEVKTTFIDYRNETKKFILHHEGGMSNHRSDPGGWTNKGVTFSTFKLFSKKLGYKPSVENFKSMPDTIWDKIFELHWDMFDGVEDHHLRSFCTDYLWGSGNMGITNIQSVVKLYVPSQKIDGRIGEQTIKNINSCDSGKLLDSLYKHRIHFLKNLPHSQHFYVGWKRRVDSLMNKFKRWKSLQKYV